MASTSTPAPLRGQKIYGCFLTTDNNNDNNNDNSITGCSSQPTPLLPVTLRIFYDPAKNHAFFRLYTIVELEVASQPSSSLPFFLDISPDKIRTLSLHHHHHHKNNLVGSAIGIAPGPNLSTTTTTTTPPPKQQCISFLFIESGSISLIAPQALPPGHLHPATPAARARLEAIRLLVQQDAVCVFLPPAAVADNELQNRALAACCQAVSAQELCVTPLRPDPVQTTLRSLYHGKGGRLVNVDEELVFSSDPSSPPSPDHNHPPPPPPPAYGDVTSPHLPPPPPSASLSPPQQPTTPTPPGPHKKTKGRKRVRISSPSTPDSSSPDYRTWEHFNLAVGEREKMMAELLRRADKKETKMIKLMGQVDEATRHLTDLVAAAAAAAAAAKEMKEAGWTGHANIDEAAQQIQQAQTHKLDADAADTPTTALSDQGTGSGSGSGSSTASFASNISDRVQAYITNQLDQLREEIRARGYTTTDDVEELLDGRFVQEDTMYEAIREAVDESMDQVRDRVLDAWL